MVERLWLVWAAPAIGIAAWAAAEAVRRRRVRLAARWSPDLGRVARASGRVAPWVIGLAALLAALAAAGPRWGRTTVTATARSLSVVFGADISRSMLAEDVAPSRLQRAAQQIRRLLQDLDGDRVGLIAFSGRSYILAPLTIDGGAVRIFVDALDPDLASEGGTNLALPLGQGGELLSASGGEGDRVLVLFTDGEGHDTLPEAVARAKALGRAGIKLVLVAEGGTEPARIPVRDSLGRFVDYQVDAEGRQVRTARDDAALRAIAEAAGGSFIGADEPDQAGAVRDLLATFERGAASETRVSDLVPRAWMPALVAALLLIGYTLGRRGLALVAVALCVVPATAWAQRPSPGARAAASGDARRAADAYLREAAGATARDTALYNAGTAALRAQQYDVARKTLNEAAKSLDPELRYRALYNLGLAGIEQAQHDSAQRDTLLDEAAARLRAALLLEPASARAKWNLELAERRRPPTPPRSGGGGGGGGGGGRPPSPPPQDDKMNQRQAEQILESMERQERETRQAQQRRAQARSGGVKDW